MGDPACGRFASDCWKTWAIWRAPYELAKLIIAFVEEAERKRQIGGTATVSDPLGRIPLSRTLPGTHRPAVRVRCRGTQPLKQQPPTGRSAHLTRRPAWTLPGGRIACRRQRAVDTIIECWLDELATLSTPSCSTQNPLRDTAVVRPGDCTLRSAAILVPLGSRSRTSRPIGL